MEQAGSHTRIGTGMHITQTLNYSGRILGQPNCFNLFMVAASGILRASAVQMKLSTSEYGEKSTRITTLGT